MYEYCDNQTAFWNCWGPCKGRKCGLSIHNTNHTNETSQVGKIFTSLAFQKMGMLCFNKLVWYFVSKVSNFSCISIWVCLGFKPIYIQLSNLYHNLINGALNLKKFLQIIIDDGFLTSWYDLLISCVVNAPIPIPIILFYRHNLPFSEEWFVASKSCQGYYSYNKN